MTRTIDGRLAQFASKLDDDGNSIVGETTANLADVAATINTEAKAQGKQVYNTDDDRPVWATGALDSDLWVYADGTTAHTPI